MYLQITSTLAKYSNHVRVHIKRDGTVFISVIQIISCPEQLYREQFDEGSEGGAPRVTEVELQQ